MTESLAIALHKQRLNEFIDYEQFANEMQTTYPRHIIQDFMHYVSEHNHHEMMRHSWLEVFCYWMDLNEGELCSDELPSDEFPKRIIRFCDAFEVKEHE
jgi:hypothetical protein